MQKLYIVSAAPQRTATMQNFTLKKNITMKERTFILTLIFAVACGLTSCDNHEQHIDFGNLPEAAQLFIDRHFDDCRISYILKGNNPFSDSYYEVVFANGYEVDFDRKGEWSEVDCKTYAVPTAIIPTDIALYVGQQFPRQYIVKINRDRHEYEVELNSDIELVFDKNGNFKHID